MFVIRVSEAEGQNGDSYKMKLQVVLHEDLRTDLRFLQQLTHQLR